MPPASPTTEEFHLGRGWYGAWQAAYLESGMRSLSVDGLPLIEERARLGPLPYRRLTSQTNVHTPRLDVANDDALTPDFPARLMGAGKVDMVRMEYVAGGSRLLAAARGWAGHNRITITPQALVPAVDCRRSYDQWLAGRSKRGRSRWPKLERGVIQTMGMRFEVLDGRTDLPELLADIFAVERSGWKGQEGTAISDSHADTLFYTRLAEEAAAAGALRIAVLRYHGRIVAFEYGLLSADRLFLLKVGYDETYEKQSIGHVLTVMNIRHCCEDPAIAWYDKLGNGLRPAPYKLRFADTLDTLYRITLYGPGWRSQALWLYQIARIRAKTIADRWRGRKPVTLT